MQRYLTILGLVLISMGFCFFSAGCGGIPGSGVAKTETRALADFQKIKVSGALALQVKCGEKTAFDLTADDNLLQYIKTEVKDGMLTISTEQSISPSVPVSGKVSCEKLTDFSVSGAVDASIQGMSQDAFQGSVQGAGNIKVSGTAKQIALNVNGAAAVDAGELKGEKAQVEVNGAGKVSVFCTEELVATVNGVGAIDYFGDPKSVKPTMNGLGKINKR